METTVNGWSTTAFALVLTTTNMPAEAVYQVPPFVEVSSA